MKKTLRKLDGPANIRDNNTNTTRDNNMMEVK